MRFPLRQERRDLFKAVSPEGRATLCTFTAKYNAMSKAKAAEKKAAAKT